MVQEIEEMKHRYHTLIEIIFIILQNKKIKLTIK